jgi:hypothetical protein
VPLGGYFMMVRFGTLEAMTLSLAGDLAINMGG